MALTRDFKDTIVARIKSDPDFAKALLDEAATLFFSGETETMNKEESNKTSRRIAPHTQRRKQVKQRHMCLRGNKIKKKIYNSEIWAFGEWDIRRVGEWFLPF